MRKLLAVLAFSFFFWVPMMAVDACAQSPSASTLQLNVPADWTRDVAGEKAQGAFRVFVPKGSTWQDASATLIITFDKKVATDSGLDNLKDYWAYDMAQTLSQAKDAQFARWQPSKLSPDTLHFMSIEIYGKQPNQPAPQHLLVIDTGDGFYSVVLTVRTRDMLQLPLFDEFFNGLGLSASH